jgi:hypothetical protein
MKVTLELTAADGGDTAEVWEAMKEDFATDPRKRMMLETRGWFIDARPVEE